MWQRAQVAIDGVLPMCFKITNLGSTFIAGEVWHKPNEISSPILLNLRLTFMLTVFAVCDGFAFRQRIVRFR
jgi:hypothetical protein